MMRGGEDPEAVMIDVRSEGEDTEAEEAADQMEAVTRLERDLCYMPLQPADEDQKTDAEEDWELVHSSDEEKASITSHEFGTLPAEESEEESSSEGEYEQEQGFLTQAVTKKCSKQERSEINYAVREVQKVYVQREKEELKKKKERICPVPRRSKTGPWRVLELFTWTCMISLCAVHRGNWEMMEPISLPNWDLFRADDREAAIQYLRKADPDLLVVAWPCGPWSVLQGLGNKTPQQLHQLGLKRQKARILLRFVKQAVMEQRARGGAVLGENPVGSIAWQEPTIQEALEGLPEVITDMCQYGLKKPKEDHEAEEEYLRKRTRLRGNPEILERCARKCDSRGHQHAPMLGGVKIGGRWQPLSDFAGGYTRAFSIQVVKGAEEYLKKGRRQEVYAERDLVPEERFQEMEEEEQNEDEEEEAIGEELLRSQRSKISKLELVHRRLGHLSNEVLCRMLKLAGADRDLQEEAAKLKCDICGSGPIPRRPMAQRSDMRPVTFNETIAIDLKFVNDCQEQRYVALSMIDTATNYHQAALLRNRNPDHCAKKFLTKWVALFGTPTWIHLDQGGEWEAEFILFLEHHAIGTRVTGSHSGWQLGHAERHGALLGTAWSALIYEHQVTDREGMKTTLMCAVQAKNQLISRRGYSANTLVFGKQSNFPDLLDDDPVTSTTLGQALSTETEVARQAEMRALAKRALLHKDAQEKLKRALTRKPGGQIKEFLLGEKIFFWVPRVNRGRYRHGYGEWRGPAIVIVKESHEKYFVSWRARCLLLAAANMRGATMEENADVGLEELQGLEEGWKQQDKEYQDLSQIQRQPEETSKDQGWEAQEGILKYGKRKGRTKRDAVAMMKGLKSVQRLVRSKFQKQKRASPKEPRQRKKTEKEKRIEEEARRDLEEFEGGGPQDEMSYEPTEPGEIIPDEMDDEFWKEVKAQEDAYEEEDEKRKKEQAERRRKLLDDVPVSLKRKQTEEEEQDRLKMPRTMFQQLEVMVSDHELQGKIRRKVLRHEEQRRRMNQWLQKDEVDQMSRLLNLPLSAVRLHRTPRRKLQELPKEEQKRRITMMLLQEPGQALLVDESKEDMKRPKKKSSVAWRGMTLFVREKRVKTVTPKVGHEVYVQLGEDTFKTTLKSEEDCIKWKELVRREKVWQKYRQVLLLKLKASGKELDPRWFNEEETKAFKDSDRSEWEAWVKNGVIERLTPEQGSKVPSSAVFKIPLRIVRVNKSKDPKVLQAKSRVVIPGHMDPGLGEYRSDSPTTTPTAIRLMKSISVTCQWVCYAFDVATAFLSGKHTSRLVYVRAPPDGLPGTSMSDPVSPFELMRVVKSAYGLSEAPRLWYLRAVELLQQCGMVELSFCRSTFIAKDEKEVFAFCGLHVDDGFLCGNPRNPKFEELRKSIDQKFNIKAWENVGMKGTDYLGMKVYYDEKQQVMTDDMTDYVLKIENVHLPSVPKGKLFGEHVTRFRQLVMKMRWPAQHVFPEFMYRISSLAQRVGTASYDDMKEAHALCAEMRLAAEQGQAKLVYRPLKGEPMFVSYFDAALGRKNDGSAQSGELHLITDVGALRESRNANVIEYHSNKIARVVRSSMAAESCALTKSTDHQLYNRLLYDALKYGHTEVHSDWRSTLRVSGVQVTDAKALFDHCHTTGGLAQERQTAIDLLMAKQWIEEKLMTLKWVPTFKQVADALTKSMKDTLLTLWKKNGQVCLVSTAADQAEETRRSQIRRGQRERRAARLKSSKHSLPGM